MAKRAATADPMRRNVRMYLRAYVRTDGRTDGRTDVCMRRALVTCRDASHEKVFEVAKQMGAVTAESYTCLVRVGMALYSYGLYGYGLWSELCPI